MFVEEYDEFEWISKDIEKETDLSPFVITLDSVVFSVQKSLESFCIPEFPDYFMYTKNLLKSISSNFSITQQLISSLSLFSNYFSKFLKLTNYQQLQIYDLCNFYSIVIQNIKKENILSSVLELTSAEFETFLHVYNYMTKFIQFGRCKNPLPYLKHSILASVGVRTIKYSKITLIYPIHSHSFVLNSSILLNLINPRLIYSADLECQSLLVVNSEIYAAYKLFIVTNLDWVVEARFRDKKTLTDSINSLGEL